MVDSTGERPALTRFRRLILRFDMPLNYLELILSNINEIYQGVSFMGLVTGSLTSDLGNYHLKSKAELAVMIIDEKGSWPIEHGIDWSGELPEQEEKRKESQLEVLSCCMAMECKIMIVEMLPTFKTADYICSHIKDYPIDKFIKDRCCAISSTTKPSLTEFISKNKITSIVVMGGYSNGCVYATATGGEDFSGPGYQYSGLEAMGITLLSSPALLSPYLPKFNLSIPFKASAISRNEKGRFDMPTECSWPFMIFNRGVRIYTEI